MIEVPVFSLITSGTVPQVRPHMFPSSSVPIHDSLFIIPFDSVQSELHTASLQ
jgi:hypothetical protein